MGRFIKPAASCQENNAIQSKNLAKKYINYFLNRKVLFSFLPRKGGENRECLENVSRLVKAFCENDIEKEDTTKHKAQQTTGGRENQQNAFL